MFALQYGSGFLDLVQGENPVIEWVSTAFNESEELLGSFSYPIELANTPNNDTLLNHSNQLASRSARVDIEVIPHLLGMPWKRCSFSYDLQDGKRKGYLKIDNGAFAALIKEKEIASVFVQTLNGTFVDHDWIYTGNTPALTNQAIINSLTVGSAPYTFFPFINDNIFGGPPAVGAPYTIPRIINPWKGTEFIWASSDVSAEAAKGLWYSPSLYLTWVIKKVCRYLGYEAIGDFMEDQFIKSLVIPNNGIYNWWDVFSNSTGFKFAPARHLPKMKITELFKALREQFRLVYYFNSDTKRAHFTFSDTIIASPERVDVEIEKKKPTTKKQTETGYELIQGFDAQDELFKSRPFVKSYFIGNDLIAKKTEVPIGTCFMLADENVHTAGSPICRMPFTRQIGNAYSTYAAGSEADNPAGTYGRNDFKLRLLSFLGLRPDSLGNLYPAATSDGLDSNGVTQIRPSLWLGGTEGILNKYHKKWYVFYLQTEQTTVRVYIPNSILARLSPVKKIRFSTLEGVGLEAMMSKVSFAADPKSRLIKADLTIFPIYNNAAVQIAANTDFDPGEILNPGETWVRLVLENPDIVYLNWPNNNHRRSQDNDVVLYFYYDQAGTQPRDVSGLRVRITQYYKGMNVENYSTNIFTYTASGVRFVPLAGTEIYYINNSGEYRTWEYVVADSENGEYFRI